MNDGDEISNGTNPIDVDWDGMGIQKVKIVMIQMQQSIQERKKYAIAYNDYIKR